VPLEELLLEHDRFEGFLSSVIGQGGVVEGWEDGNSYFPLVGIRLVGSMRAWKPNLPE